VLQSFEIVLAEDGRPLWVKLPRWSNVNPERQWRLRPFGGMLDDFRSSEGFALPTQFDGGNYFLPTTVSPSCVGG
jgi:hypothetical protein